MPTDRKRLEQVYQALVNLRQAVVAATRDLQAHLQWEPDLADYACNIASELAERIDSSLRWIDQVHPDKLSAAERASIAALMSHLEPLYKNDEGATPSDYDPAKWVATRELAKSMVAQYGYARPFSLEDVLIDHGIFD